MTDLTVDISDKTIEELSEDEPEFTHIIRRDDLERGYLLQEPVTALCGHTWVPTKNPENYPVCPKCKKIAGQLAAGRSGNN